jgi:hypothetical protein
MHNALSSQCLTDCCSETLFSIGCSPFRILLGFYRLPRFPPESIRPLRIRESTTKFGLNIIMIAQEMSLNGHKDRIEVNRGDIQDPNLHRTVCL